MTIVTPNNIDKSQHHVHGMKPIIKKGELILWQKTNEWVEWLKGRDIWTAKQYDRILGVIKIFCIFIMVVVSQIYTTLKTHQTVHFTWTQFTVCKLFLNKTQKVKYRRKERCFGSVSITFSLRFIVRMFSVNFVCILKITIQF